MSTLRPELLRHTHADGSLTLYDPLLERLAHLPAEEAAALEDARVPPALEARLAAALLLEGPVDAALRARVLSARLDTLRVPAPAPTPAIDPSLAHALPELVAPPWRDPEAWRRLAEDRAAGRAVLTLRALFAPTFASALAAELQAAPAARFDTDRVAAWRLAPADGSALTALLALLASPRFRALAGGVLGVDLPASLQWNAWRMEPGDGMRPHPDGRRYAATWALGLCDGWTAADGGAISFGTPTTDGFVVRERWLPFLGDLCLFVPHAESWHVVEPPGRDRLTVSGWWHLAG